VLIQAVKAITEPTERSIPPVIITSPIPTARIATSEDCLKILKMFLGVGKDMGRKNDSIMHNKINTRATMVSGLAMILDRFNFSFLAKSINSSFFQYPATSFRIKQSILYIFIMSSKNDITSIHIDKMEYFIGEIW